MNNKSSFARCAIIIALIGVGMYYIDNANSDPWAKKAAVETLDKMSAISRVKNEVPGWPPVVGNIFPSVALFNQEGENFSLEQLRGKPTLIEVIAMTCAGCQGFAGGNRYGGYQGFAVQDGLKSIEEYYREYTHGLELHDPKINFVQLIIYNLELEAPTAKDLAGWRKHFRLDQHPNSHVVSGGAPLANQASFKMIPGFILLDPELKVMYDSTGHQPRTQFVYRVTPGRPEPDSREVASPGIIPAISSICYLGFKFYSRSLGSSFSNSHL